MVGIGLLGSATARYPGSDGPRVGRGRPARTAGGAARRARVPGARPSGPRNRMSGTGTSIRAARRGSWTRRDIRTGPWERSTRPWPRPGICPVARLWRRCTSSRTACSTCPTRWSGPASRQPRSRSTVTSPWSWTRPRRWARCFAWRDRTRDRTLVDLRPFDAYRGPQVGEGRVSYGLAFRFQPASAADEQGLDRAMDKVRGALKHHLGAEIR